MQPQVTCLTPLAQGHLPGSGLWAHRAFWAGSMGTMPSALRSQAAQDASCGISPRVRNISATCMLTWLSRHPLKGVCVNVCSCLKLRQAFCLLWPVRAT